MRMPTLAAPLSRIRVVPYPGMSSVAFVGLSVASISIARGTLITLATKAYAIPEYSHVITIIPLSAVLIWIERKRIFAKQQTDLTTAFLSMGAWGVLAAVLVSVARSTSGGVELAASMSALVTFWIAAFCACFGTSVTRRAMFPLLFLLLLVPVPEHLMDVLVGFLQHASGKTVEWLFRATGVPFLRDGQRFALAGIQIEIAKECSGIRSAIALFITGLLSAHLLLQSKWSKAVLLLAIVPLAIAKNGLRIFTLSILAVYFDPAVLSSALHSRGGFVFFGIALLTLFAILHALMRVEKRFATRAPSRSSAAEERVAHNLVEKESAT